MGFSRSRRCYRFLLRLYPAPFREANGKEMESVFATSLRIQRKRWGRLGVPIGWVYAVWDTLWHSLRIRVRGNGSRAGCRHPGSGPPGRRYPGPGRLGRMRRALWEDGRFAARHLGRNRAFTLLAVGTLALGIGLNTAVFGAVYSLLLRPLPGADDPDRLVQLYRTRGVESRFLPSSIPLYRDLRASSDVFSGVTAWTFSSLSVSTGERAEREMAQVVSSEFFDVLGVSMVWGRGFSDVRGEVGPEERVVVVSQRFWQSRLGGAPGVIGTTVEINGAPWEIIGVAPEEFRGPMPVLAPVLWAPLSHHPFLMRGGDQSENRGNNFLEVVARLKPGVAFRQAEEWAGQLGARLREAYPEHYEQMEIRLHPQNDAGIHPAFRGAQVGLSGVLMGVVGLLLVIACVNVAGLFLAKAQGRRREVALRRSLGAPRRRLVSQLLMESLLLSLLAGGVGLLLAVVVVDGMNSITVPLEWTLEWNIALDGPVLAFTLGVTLITSLIFGLTPALRSSDPDLVSTLKGSGSTKLGRPVRSGRLLVGAQVAVSTVLLVCAGLFAKNLRNATAVDTGFRHDGLMLATLDPALHGSEPAATQALFHDLLTRARALPGVESVSLARYLPMGIDGAQRGVVVPGYQPSREESMNIQINIVDSEYFSTMGIPVVEGRGFLASEGEMESRAAVVNRRFAERFWPGQSAIGRPFDAGGRGWQVVGVVPTGKYQTLGEEPRAFIYLPWPTLRAGEMTLHVRSALEPGSILPLLRAEVETMAPGLPLYDVKTMEEHLALALLPARVGALLLGVLGALCLFLLSVGIHGVVAYQVSHRTREVGIRVAMGAEPRSATGLVLGQEARVVVVGVLIGLAGALATSRLVASVLYSRDALDPAVLVGAPLFLVIVAMAASYLPARRAARVDPAQALREE